ncbi:MAG TPA: FAD-dependent oxidoreductase [Acetobacteraceae bacterium]|nr:FAD-dependent oxidoreductase [Acetobacteraceae bacterium]
MDADPARIVIVGAGHAGGAVAANLRQFGWRGPITLIGEEPLPPYQRPPLSKAWLKREADAASLLLRPAAFYASNDIALRLEQRVTGIDRTARQVRLATGSLVPYDRLVLALGSVVRPLAVSGTELRGVLSLRNAADADRLQAALRPGARLAVIGGGYIGLEVAASARALGAAAVVIEREDRVLARVAGPLLSDFFQRQHRARGVQLELGAVVETLEGDGGAITGVRLRDGRLIPCDVALVGIGAVANDALAQAAGLQCGGGIVVDATGRSSDPAIYAIGDCSNRPLPLYRRSVRLESVPNALEMAKQAAAALCGRPPPPSEVPWFWSDQFDLRLQIAGLLFDAVQTAVRGDPDSGRFAVFHLAADDTVQAVEAVNAPAEFMAGKLMIARRRRAAAEQLRDPACALQQLAA